MIHGIVVGLCFLDLVQARLGDFFQVGSENSEYHYPANTNADNANDTNDDDDDALREVRTKLIIIAVVILSLIGLCVLIAIGATIWGIRRCYLERTRPPPDPVAPVIIVPGPPATLIPPNTLPYPPSATHQTDYVY